VIDSFLDQMCNGHLHSLINHSQTSKLSPLLPLQLCGTLITRLGLIR